MTIYLIAALLTASMPNPSVDQTEDAALLLSFLSAIKGGADMEARAMIAPEAFIGDYGQKVPSSFREFAEYAQSCRLVRIDVPTSRDGSRNPIGAEWRCAYPEQDRTASFWFEGSRISRIGWGKRSVVKLAPFRSR